MHEMRNIRRYGERVSELLKMCSIQLNLSCRSYLHFRAVWVTSQLCHNAMFFLLSINSCKALDLFWHISHLDIQIAAHSADWISAVIVQCMRCRINLSHDEKSRAQLMHFMGGVCHQYEERYYAQRHKCTFCVSVTIQCFTLSMSKAHCLYISNNHLLMAWFVWKRCIFNWVNVELHQLTFKHQFRAAQVNALHCMTEHIVYFNEISHSHWTQRLTDKNKSPFVSTKFNWNINQTLNEHPPTVFNWNSS